VRKLSWSSRPGGPFPMWAPSYMLGHRRAYERTPRRLPSGRWSKSNEPKVLGSGGSGHGGHRHRGGLIRGNGEGNGSPEQRLHGGARRVGRSTGEGLEERRRLELELLVSSMGMRQSSWHDWLGRGTTGGVGLTVWCSIGRGGRCQLCFGDFLRGRLGGR
jgi:hypothetical protein